MGPGAGDAVGITAPTKIASEDRLGMAMGTTVRWGVDARDPEPSAVTVEPEQTAAPALRYDDEVHLAGDRVGRYVVLSQLGSGGMGIVYTAYDPELDRKVALKVVRSWLVGREEAHTRFVREARAMARISHRGVVPIHDVGTLGDSVFLAMELVDGRNARRWLDEEKPRWRRAVATLLDVGRGLAAAHAAGIVHRDVKPANILVGSDGAARVTDFGLARTELDESTGPDAASSDEAPADPDAMWPATTTASDALTRTGAILGTPAYMAPEQHLGRRADARSDQFSFCVVLYESVYGEPPFDTTARGDLPIALALAAEVTGGRVRPAPKKTKVPAWLRRILLRGLAASPEARWPSMAALLDAIEETPRRRRRSLIIAATAAAVVIVGASFLVGRATPVVATDPCQGGAALLASAWPPAARTSAVARLAGLGAYGRSAAPRIAAALDDYAGRWATGHREACVAHRRGAQSDALFDRRMLCLERGRDALAALASVVETAAEPTLPGAVVAASMLPDPAACADAAGLLAQVAPPPPEKAAAAAAIAAEIERAQVYIDAGRYDAAEREAQAAAAQARALGYAPLVARALSRQGLAAMNVSGGGKGAVPLLAEAARIAVEVGDDALAVEAWARERWIRGALLNRPDGGLEGLDLVAGLAARPASTPFARALLFNNVGSIAIAQGRFDEARGWLARALPDSLRVTGAGALEMVNVQGNLARATPDPAARDAMFAAAITRLTHLVGDDHPSTLRMGVARGSWNPALSTAIAVLQPACVRYDQFHATLVGEILECWSEVAFLAEERGQHRIAIEALRHAAASGPKDGAGADEVAGYLALLGGDAAMAARRFDDARQRLTLSPDAPWWRRYRRATLALGLGRARLAAGDPAAARQVLDDSITDLLAVAVANPSPVVTRRLIRARAELARSLAMTGPATDAMREAARLAAHGLRDEGGRDDEIAELEQLAVRR